MAADVKRKRPYSSRKRREQARETRRRVVDAARRLFSQAGYASTTVEAVAKEAGVAVQTVYSAVGGKRDLLWAALEIVVAGDDEPRALLERFEAELAPARGTEERLRRAVRFGADVMERSLDVHRIMRRAAGTDADIEAALDEAERRRWADARAVVRLVAGDRGGGRDAARAVDLWFACTSYEMYELLVVRRGWSLARYEGWVVAATAPALG